MEAVRGWVWIFSGIAQFRPAEFIRTPICIPAGLNLKG